MRTIRQAATLLALLLLSGCAEEWARMEQRREAFLAQAQEANTWRCSTAGLDTTCYRGDQLASEVRCKSDAVTGTACTTTLYPL